MNRLLDPQNKFFTAVGFLGDHFVLGLLWVLASIPVVTGGAATAAACRVSRKLWLGEEQKLVRDFFEAFKNEFSLATKLWLAVLAVGAVLAVDVAVYLPMAESSALLMGFTGLLILFYLTTLCWLYPYTAVFKGGFVRCVKMAFLLGMSNLGWSFLILLVDVLLLAATLYAPWLLPFLPGLLTLTATLVCGRVFRKYLPKEAEN